MEQVILVDEQDKATGSMEKLQAHVEGRLHRAISVFIFNSRNELLLQQRADGKYHSPLLWTNTCCSHPRPGEDVNAAAHRRLQEEMGLSCALKETFSFIYKADMGNGLTEYEYDHVFTGITDDEAMPDDTEVAAWKYMQAAKIKRELAETPEKYTPWFHICMTDWYTELFNAKKQ